MLAALLAEIRMMRLLLPMLSLALLSFGAPRPSRADTDPCSGYKWDVSVERALFAMPAKPAAAGKDRASAGAVVPNQFYAVTLLPLSEVSFPAAPSRTPPSGSFAGIVTLTVPTVGKYRVAVDVPLWIDVVGGAAIAPVLDYEGLHECSAPRKVVVFDLAGRKDWTLQLSAADRVTVRLTVTPVR
jgi:hypothetical protein